MSLADDIAAAEEDRDRDREVRELRGALRRAQRKLTKREEYLEAYRTAVYEAARDAALIVGVPDPIPPPPARKKRGASEVAVLHLTDWQLGKRTSSYNSDVCEERVQRVVQKTLRLIDIQRADHPVDRARVLLGGDMVENLGIFPGQAHEVDSSVVVQVFRAAALVEAVVLALLEKVREVEVDCTDGNHGRIGRRGDHPDEDNFDRFVYEIARKALAGQKRLKWNQQEKFYAPIVEGEYRAILVHGDQVKQWGGAFPGHGLLKKATAWKAGGIKFNFRDVYIGHLHQPIVLQMPDAGLLRMTPSTESDSDYASEFVGAIGRPAQRLNFVSPAKGIVTAEYLIWLDD